MPDIVRSETSRTCAFLAFLDSVSRDDVSTSVHSLLDIHVSLNRQSHDRTAICGLQKALMAAGYYFDLHDGVYGDATRKAVLEFQLDTGIIGSVRDSGAGVFGQKTHAALLSHLRNMLSISAHESAVSLLGFSPYAERRLRRHHKYDLGDHESTIMNRTYPGRLRDHEVFLSDIFDSSVKNIDLERVRSMVLPPQMDSVVFVDIGPGIANTDPLLGRAGKPAISLQEMAERFPKMPCFALDMPSEMDRFISAVDPVKRDECLAKPNIHLVRGDGLMSLKEQLSRDDTNPYPERPRPAISDRATLVVRAANSIDVYCDWEKQVQPTLQRMTKDFRENPIMFFFNREILIKPAHSDQWHLVGQVSNMGFRHNDRVLARGGHPPYVLFSREVDRVYSSGPLDTTQVGIHKIFQDVIAELECLPESVPYGIIGSRVMSVQRALALVGYFRHSITGYFGPITKEALGHFQLDHGIVRDPNYPSLGTFGPRTKKILIETLHSFMRRLDLTIQRHTPLDMIAHTVKTQAYVTAHAPEYADFFRDLPNFLDSVGGLEEYVNILNGRNDFLRRVVPLSREGRETLTVERCHDQQQYLEKLQEKYHMNAAVRHPDRLSLLYRLNGVSRSYFDELQALRSQIPFPMHSECRLSVVLPAYNEAKNIYKTLGDWITQVGLDGKLVDPRFFEIIILVNKPNVGAQFDRTEDEVVRFKRDHPAYARFIHCVQKTFHFLPKVSGGNASEMVDVCGQSVSVPRGTAMGMIYKLCGDLAVLRNYERLHTPDNNISSLQQRVADHLIRTGGADAYGRNPVLLTNIMRMFHTYPSLDQYKSEAEFPPTVFEKMPLVHVVERFRQGMNRLFTQGGAAYGLGTYRAALYAEVGGFNMALPLAEELNLATRMNSKTPRGRQPNVYKATTLNAVEDPRRRVLRFLKGKSTVTEYDDFDENREVRTFQLSHIPESLPSVSELTPENLSFHLTSWLVHFMRRAYGGSGVCHKNFRLTFDTMNKYAAVCLLAMGFDVGDFEVTAGSNMDDPAGPAKITIHSLEHILPQLERYKRIPKPAWMRAVR